MVRFSRHAQEAVSSASGIVMLGRLIVCMIAYMILDRDLIKHDTNERAVETEPAAVHSRL